MSETSRYIYLVNQFDAEPYEDYCTGVHAVFSTMDKALDYLEGMGKGPFTEEVSEEAVSIRYYLSPSVEVMKIDEPPVTFEVREKEDE